MNEITPESEVFWFIVRDNFIKLSLRGRDRFGGGLRCCLSLRSAPFLDEGYEAVSVQLRAGVGDIPGAAVAVAHGMPKVDGCGENAATGGPFRPGVQRQLALQHPHEGSS
jgi:hypothetical protein